MPDLLHIPGDLFLDLLTGLCGPIETRRMMDGEWVLRPVLWHEGVTLNAADHRLPLLRPEATDHAARVLARGVRCPGCPACQPVDASGESELVQYLLTQGACGDCGGIVRSVDEARRHDSGDACEEENDAHPERALTVVYVCNGTGYLRKPAPVWHLVDAERTGALTREQVAAAIGWSALSVARGGRVLRGVLAPPAPVRFAQNVGGRALISGRPVIGSRPASPSWWHVDAVWYCVSTDGEALAARFALLADDGTITFPEIPDAR